MGKQYRIFLYLDEMMVSQLLEQVEGGEYGEEQISRQQQGGRSFGGALAAGPAKAHADVGKGSSEDSATVLKPTAPSRFARLYDALREDNAVQDLDVADDEIWDQIPVGEIVECAVDLAVPSMYKMFAMVDAFSSLIPVIDEVRALADGENVVFDEEAMAEISQKLPTITQAAAVAKQAPLHLETRLVDSPRYVLYQPLKRSCLATGIEDLEGEARVLAKIQRKIAKAHPHTIQLLAPGIPAPNRAERRSGQGDDFTITLRYPAAIVSPIAIYR